MRQLEFWKSLPKRTLKRNDFLLMRAAIYALLSILAGIGYALLVSGLGLLVSQGILPDTPLISGVLIFILALVLFPIWSKFQIRLDALFFRGHRAFQDRIQTFNRELTKTGDHQAVLRLLRLYVEDTLQPVILHVFLYNGESEEYGAAPDLQGRITSDLRFSNQAALVQFLSVERRSLSLSGSATLPPAFQGDMARLTMLGATVFIPLPGRSRLVGWLALGPPRSREPYTNRDITYVESLCDLAALALERAQVVANIEHRVRELNVLTRIAQGLSVTVTFDDILELIYAQTNQLFPNRDFRLTLYDPETGVFQHAFFLRNDERLAEFENLPIPDGQTLDQEVIRTGRALAVDDYAQECTRRGIQMASNEGQSTVWDWQVAAWMGVPLIAGTDTIGALCLGSRDHAVSYAASQHNLFQAIADQTAGAIVKARLLRQTEQRALQLTALNDIIRQLTSTLELSPLLRNILESAVQILRCEAGSLLLVDEHTGELVFQVVTGPVADNLVGRRMQAGSGVVGNAVYNRQPAIVNDAQGSPEWYREADMHTGFITKALLAAPMLVKENVIGVIEVINKQDGLPFGSDDLNLLSAFAGHAAVAIENARLYTLTDQALAARVRELSAMQRLDRDLNASLDLQRVMKITLDWAIRHSGASAGFACLEENRGYRVMDTQGYPDGHDAGTVVPLVAELVEQRGEIRDGIPLVLQEGSASTPVPGLLGAKSQVLVPIRRETHIVGLIFLESCDPVIYSPEILAFLNRLSDHAAIAISNAQLFAAVQTANSAKSEFVSFVSHELKNPMTSIKGYTELLAAGAVGPVSEAQMSFLNTIRSNVERMATLVSDLADVLRIEAGRLKLDFKSVAMEDVIGEVERSTHRQMEEKNHRLEVSFLDQLPLMWADQNRVIQILTNLVSNAIKYTPSGGRITVSAECSQNRWDPAGAQAVVHIQVKDNGYGIAPEEQGRIFQKFFRSEDPQIREVPGTGLGLNITRSLVEMQAGKIWFESLPGVGSTFHITIPVSAYRR